MLVERIEEHAISHQTHQEIERLLTSSFSEYPVGRTYFKQIPDFRLLFRVEDHLAGHLAVEYRIINLAGETARIFGIADFCVDADFRNQKIGSQLLQYLEKYARQFRIDFLLLIAAEHSFYLPHGYQAANNRCRWLMIQNNQSFGIADRRIDNCLMVKPLGKRPWKEGTVDFLGHLF
jgi:GNAT superfamily N-acetyltransferase